MEITGNLNYQVPVGVDDSEMEPENSLGEDDKEEATMMGDSTATEHAEPDMGLDLEVSSPTRNPNEIERIDLEPFVGMIFESEVEAYHLYNEYAKQLGFGIRKKLCRRSKANNDVIAGWYVCSRQGIYVRSEKTVNPRYVTRVGCHAEMKVKRMAVRKWEVTDFIKEHNHELDPENARLFRSHRKIHASEKNLIQIMSRNVGLRERISFTYKEQQKILSAAEAHAIHMHFMRMRSKNPAFTYAMDFDKEQHVKNAFWADTMSKVAYAHFGDVVTFDTTYLTNKYKIPFASFVGLNHHGQPILLGCALLADETTMSFKWLFKTWLETMSGNPPKALITDRSKAITAAVAEVFPETCHRFCLWHILKRVPEKLGYVCRAQENFMKKFSKCIYDSMTDSEFEERWWNLNHRFGLMNDEWLQSLYDDRRHWVPVYLKVTFFAGMSISQRGESLNSFFDNYVSRQTNLKKFLEKYELALRNRYEDEAQEDMRSFHSLPEERMHPSPFELQLANVYTRNMFEKFQAEVLGISSVFASKVEEDEECCIYMVKAYEVQEDNRNKKVKEKEYKVVWNESVRKIYCICHLFEFKGYLCRHALAVLLASRVLEIPSHYILKRWTKDAKSGHVWDVDCSIQGDCSDSIAQRFNDICVRSFRFAHEASLSKKSYEIALCALHEALEKVVSANNNARKVDQCDNPRSTGYYRVSEGSQANNLGTMLFVPNHLGTMLVVCDPQVFQTAGMPNKRIKYGVEKRASKPKEQKCSNCNQFGHNDTTCPEGQLSQAQLVSATSKKTDIRNDILPSFSQEDPIDIDD